MKTEMVPITPIELWAVVSRERYGSRILYMSESKEQVFHARNRMMEEGILGGFVRLDMVKIIEEPSAFIDKTLVLHTT